MKRIAMLLTLLAGCAAGGEVRKDCACYYEDGFCCPAATPFLCLYDGGPHYDALVQNTGPTCVADSRDCPGSSARCRFTEE